MQSLNLLAFVGTCLAAYKFTNYMRKTNIIYGITYKFTFVGLAIKYFLLPQFVQESVHNFWLKPKFDKNIAPILQKYSFDEKVYRDFYDALPEPDQLDQMRNTHP